MGSAIFIAVWRGLTTQSGLNTVLHPPCFHLAVTVEPIQESRATNQPCWSGNSLPHKHCHALSGSDLL